MSLFSEAQRTALREANNRFVILFRLATPTPVRLWSGAGDLPVPADSVEPAPALYLGFGALPDLPGIEALINGRAQRMEFGLSAPDPDGSLAALAESEAVAARYKPVHIGLWPLDASWQPVGAVKWLWRGVAHGTSVETDRRNPARPTATVTVSAGSRFTGRRQAKAIHYTPADQALDAPADRGFDNVAALSEGVEKKWPKG